MSGKVLQNSTWQDIKQGWVKEGDAWYPINKGYRLVEEKGTKTWEEINLGNASYDPVFANNTWEQIIEACQTNKVPDTWGVSDGSGEDGNSKIMLINGSDFSIDIIGRDHDEYYDGSGLAPLTFQMRQCFSDTWKMRDTNTNSGGWILSNIKTNISSFAERFPELIQNNIRTVKKYTSEGSNLDALVISEESFFLLSEVEINSEDGEIVGKGGEGTQYAYYTTSENKIKKKISSETAAHWWTRSPAAGSNQSQFVRISGRGTPVAHNASSVMCISLAFCF